MCIVTVLCTRMMEGSLVLLFVLLLVLRLYVVSSSPILTATIHLPADDYYHDMLCVLIYTNFSTSTTIYTLDIYHYIIIPNSFQEMYPSSPDYVSLMVSSPVSLVGHVPSLVRLDVVRRSFRRVCPSLVTGEF